MRGHRDLERAVWTALLCALATLVLPFELVQILFAIPLTLFLPGYAIAAASFARTRLAWPFVLLLSVALSLCVLALGTLLLNYLPGGVREISWALLLLLVIFNGCRLAALRRPRAPVNATAWPRPSQGQALLLSGGGLAALAALVLAMTALPANNALGYTELWISTPDTGHAAADVRIGVRSQEKREVAYFLRVRFGSGKPIVRLFRLNPGESTAFSLSTPPSDEAMPITAALFRQAQPTKVYRRVVLVAPDEQVAAAEGNGAGEGPTGVAQVGQ